MNSINFQQVFSKLSHIKALSQDHKYEEVVKNIILYSFVQSPNTSLKHINEVAENVKNVYGISIKNSVIQPIVDKLLNSKELEKNAITKRITISAESFEIIKNRIGHNIHF